MQIVIIVVDALFLSTLSLRRATHRSASSLPSTSISIHALLAESDVKVSESGSTKPNFYPRSPCGERRQPPTPEPPRVFRFLSTLSLRRATSGRPENPRSCAISIHALLAESDKPAEHHASSQQEFLSTLSLRRATVRRK